MRHETCLAHSDDMHYFSMGMPSDKEDVFVMWWMRIRLNEEATRMKYRVHPYFNSSGELGTFVVARELGQDNETFR